MIKKLCQLEHIVNDNECKLICNDTAPIHFLKEALFQFQKMIGAIEDSALAQQKAQEEAAKPKEDLLHPQGVEMPIPE